MARGSLFLFGICAPVWLTSNLALLFVALVHKYRLKSVSFSFLWIKGKGYSTQHHGVISTISELAAKCSVFASKGREYIAENWRSSDAGDPSKESFFKKIYEDSIHENAGWISYPPSAYPLWQMLPWEFSQQRLFLSRCSSACYYVYVPIYTIDT